MEAFAAPVALCKGNSPVTGQFPSHLIDHESLAWKHKNEFHGIIIAIEIHWLSIPGEIGDS